MTVSAETKAALALVAAGVSPAQAERLLPSLGLDVLASDTQITAAVESLRTDLPAVFAPAPAPAPGRPVLRDVSKPADRELTGIEAGQARARARFGTHPSGGDAA